MTLETKLCDQGLDVLKVLNGPELAKASRKCPVFRMELEINWPL